MTLPPRVGRFDTYLIVAVWGRATLTNVNDFRTVLVLPDGG